jgi:hypothetical protein
MPVSNTNSRPTDCLRNFWPLLVLGTREVRRPLLGAYERTAQRLRRWALSGSTYLHRASRPNVLRFPCLRCRRG